MQARSVVAVVLIGFLAGCTTTRSISNSGYDTRGYYGGNFGYRGELSEFDVLGIESAGDVSEETIRDALATPSDRKLLQRGAPVLLIQSGATFPDEAMLGHLKDVFSVTAFSGVPRIDPERKQSYAGSLRLAAARGGVGTIIVYWGVLESGVEDLATKTVSWVPIVGRAVPDESQQMRIRIKVAVVDVETGRWEMFTPEAFGDKAISARINRRNADQAQVETLKSLAYEAAAREIVARFVR